MSASQRRKGAGFEREVASLLSAEFGVPVQRKLEGPRGSVDDIAVGPFSVECKRRAQISVYEWLDQAARNAPVGALPIVIARADGRPPIGILPWHVLCRLMRREIE